MNKKYGLTLIVVIIGLIHYHTANGELGKHEDPFGRQTAYSVVADVGEWKRMVFSNTKSLSANDYILILANHGDFNEWVFKNVNLLLDGKVYNTRFIESKVEYEGDGSKGKVSSVSVGFLKDVAKKLMSAKRVIISVSFYGRDPIKVELSKVILDEWKKVIMAFPMQERR